MTGSAATAGSSTDASDKAMSRGDRLRALVRAHQHLIEERAHLTQRGAPPNPQIEHDVAAIAERITNLLSNPKRTSPDPATDARKE